VATLDAPAPDMLLRTRREPRFGPSALRAPPATQWSLSVSSARANRRGMFALMGAMAFFAVNDMLIKLAAQRNPLGEVLTVRGLIASVLIGVFVIGVGPLGALRFALDRKVLGRTAFDGAAMVLFTLALVHMPLAEVSAINLVSPLIITALAVIFFAEEVGWRRWTAIGVGFIGTLFIVKPTPGGFNAWALLGIGCAFSAAIRDVVTRRLDLRIPTLVISLMAAVGSAVIGAVMGLFEDWRAMSLEDIGLLAVSAACIGIGHFLIVIAFRGVDVAAIAPFRYTLLIWACVCGYLAFGEVPDRFAIFGSALIVGSGLYALHREVVRRRTLAAAVPPTEPGA
jgi:drug/metabolite transporter (DMT)-like permease